MISILKPRKKIDHKSLEDMMFGFIVAKYINSNAIVLTKNLSTLGIGIGQTNTTHTHTHTQTGY